jgi:ubiquinone/menaquinone biosynthesis C-methylase UbiE
MDTLWRGEHHMIMGLADPAARMLYEMEPLRRPLLEVIVAASHIPLGSQGLDVGCGIGLQAILLAQAAGSQGHVIGLDSSASLLETAREFTRQAGFIDRISFQQGSWNQIPFQDNTFDWVWSIDAAGYAPYAPVSTVQELVRVTRSGGRLILGYWSSQCLLPGYPALEARLNATPAGLAPFTLESRAEAHYMNTLGWMWEAGLVDTHVETFARTVSAPLGAGLRDAITGLFSMRWEAAETAVSPDDWREYTRLCRAGSNDFILNRPDYYAFFTYSVFSGKVPGKGNLV